MSQINAIKIGDAIPALELPPITRLMLALYAGASGDHNPIHVDIDSARKAGMPDVFAHGMLGMAWLGRLITQWQTQAQLRSFDVRFQGITHLGNQISCHGRVVKIGEQDGERQAVIEISAVNQYGQTKIAGTAIVAVP